MTLKQFMNEALSPWMREEGPDSDIVLSSRIRLARNFDNFTFPILANKEDLEHVYNFFQETFARKSFQDYKNLEFIPMSHLSAIEIQVLVEKHLVRLSLAEKSQYAATLIPENEQVSILINEEDHMRIQLYVHVFQLDKDLEKVFELDDWLEEKIDYAFDDTKSYLTSCPTTVGTAMRASVMMHLPALALTQQI